ncbi:MAG: site-specific DNA-methyltransferase [Candidatus Sumerlaeota bacterium]|nr:site-specific DNA-methyltransferase [Candidatus Sumerlaeota bacterium]
MARRKKTESKRPIESYQHADKERVNNPPVGLVTPDTDPDVGAKQTYAYDPHLDPQLQWAGKAEHMAFEVPTVSLHVHERIDPRTIIEAVRKHNGVGMTQTSLYDTLEENPPLREAIEFYKHAHGWSNRLVAGDSLLVMNSLLEKEGMSGKVQMIYIDPPYGIKYGSNFQPFVNKRDVKDGKDEDLTSEPEQIHAFRDTWELGIHSYLTYLRDRLLLALELLTESGSIFVQISDENVHFVRCLMDEIFGSSNFVAIVTFQTKQMSLASRYLPSMNDFLLWYAKDFGKLKFNRLFLSKELTNPSFSYLILSDGSKRPMTKEEKEYPERRPAGSKAFSLLNLTSAGQGASCTYDFEFEGEIYKAKGDNSWKTHIDGMKRLKEMNRLYAPGKELRYIYCIDDFPVTELSNIWTDNRGENVKIYVVQTSTKVIQRCMLMSTDPGDLVFDPTCGSGTTAYVAEQWGRRWITCDTSRVALTLAKQRLMTALYDYYELAYPEEGIGSGFNYKTVPHVTLGSIANNEPPGIETLYDQPFIDRNITRVTGPFTVEAVPAPAVKSVEEILNNEPRDADLSIARTGETLRQSEWRDELLKTGLRGKTGQYIRFARFEPLPGCRYLHADGETSEGDAKRAVVSFGPEHAPLEQRQVEMALEEARTLVPKPKLLIFAAFQFDPEAAKDIDETNWPGMTLLKAQMNADLQTSDLKKKRASNESFWLIGQPDVQVEQIAKGEDKGKYRISVHGFDYYNTRTGNLESGGADKIEVWLLDTDYDGRSLFPRQVFFPMAGPDEGWAKLARNLKAEINLDLIEAYRGTVSLPFKPGEHKRIAVKIVDDRGIESLKILELD